MKEIGGYLSFEQYNRPILHEDGIRLNCGRSALAYLIAAKKIRKICMPYFMCSSVFDLCRKYGIELRFYHVGYDFLPEQLQLEKDEWLYLVNYYGQLTVETIQNLMDKHSRVILDNAQAYFEKPIVNLDTIYACRKFFGVADGAILFTDVKLEADLQRDEAYSHMHHLMGRYERTATEFYSENADNNKRFQYSPILGMSRLSENLLHSFDYEEIKNRRSDNFAYLHGRLAKYNQLELRMVQGAFAYPLMIENGSALKKFLIQNKIYVPTLWPNVLDEVPADSVDYRMTADILPVPCDQRYGEEEMAFICDLIDSFLK